MNKKTISVLGGGSWGTVLANLAAKNDNEVFLWMRDSETCKSINEEKINFKYLPKYLLEENLYATTEIEQISSSDIVIYCIHSDS